MKGINSILKVGNNEKKCDFGWKRENWNITEIECEDYKDRVVFIGDYSKFHCGIKLKNVIPEDQGTIHK